MIHKLGVVLEVPALQAFCFVVLSLAAGFSAPVLFWKLAPFRNIRSLRRTLEEEDLNFRFNGNIRDFPFQNVDSAKVALFWVARSSERMMSRHLSEFVSALIMFGSLQTIALIFVSLSGETELSEGWHIIIHYPIPEVFLGIITGMVSYSTAENWKSLRDWFRRDVWPSQLSEDF